MKTLYKEINTFRILPLDFMKNLGLLLRFDYTDPFPIVDGYYHWAMGHEISAELGLEVYKAFCLLGDTTNISDYNGRLEVWYKNNG